METEKLICVDCQQEFELTPGWKKLLEQKPEILPPKRCYSCRQKRKFEKEERSEKTFRNGGGYRSRW